MNDADDPEILREALRRMLAGSNEPDNVHAAWALLRGRPSNAAAAERGLASIRAAVAARRALGEQHRDPHAPPAPVEPLDLIRRMVALDDSRCIEEGSCREFYFLLDEMRELLGKGPMGPAGEERRAKGKG